MRRYLPLLCLAALSVGFVGCGKNSGTTDIGDPKTRESDAKSSMQNVLATDPSLKHPGGAPNSAAMPHAAPPGAPMGSVH